MSTQDLDSDTIPGWSGGMEAACLDTGFGSFNEAPSPVRQPLRILVVDDDPFMLGVLSQMLRDMGYVNVAMVASGESALLRAKDENRPIDVVLCDLNMPGIDGIEFLQTLTATGYRGAVILLSGEGVRIMYTVRKLFEGSPMAILGALEKPAARGALGDLLKSWRPVNKAQINLPAIVMSAGELRRAQVECPWVLHFQPKVSLRTGAFIGVEALVRWNHPDLGLIYPDQFIAAAEEFGTINALTDWVLRTAVNQLGQWHRRGLEIHMAVNISTENLNAPNFQSRLIEIVRASCCSPHDILLEITESRLMGNSSLPLETLARLRMQRFGLSIDDFGTGHSSLEQLRDVPFTELKIDRGFVLNARYNQIIRPILEGSVAIARGLELHTVAEGVESRDDWQLLREIDCAAAQGYYIGKPMPAELLPAWRQRWHSRRSETFEE